MSGVERRENAGKLARLSATGSGAREEIGIVRKQPDDGVMAETRSARRGPCDAQGSFSYRSGQPLHRLSFACILHGSIDAYIPWTPCQSTYRAH